MSKQVLCPFESDLDIGGPATVRSSTKAKTSCLSCRNLKEQVRGDSDEEEHHGENFQHGASSYLAQSWS